MSFISISLDGMLGLIFFSLVILASLYNVYSRDVDDGLAGRVLYLLSAFTSIAGIMQILNGGVSDQTIATVCWLLVARQARNSFLHWRLNNASKR